MPFTREEKCASFQKIEDAYFNRNFGSMSKADLETLLFSEYIEHCIKNGKNFDDYTLSKELGITQSRIRSLKERKELKYPYKDYSWKTAFAESIKNAKIDPHDHYIKMIIQDVNVMNDVRYFIENKGWYDECSLNKRLLRIPLDCFVEVFYDSSEFENVFTAEIKSHLKTIVNSDNSVKSFFNDFSKDGLKKFLMSASKEVISEVLKLLPFSGVAKTAFEFLRNVIERS